MSHPASVSPSSVRPPRIGGLLVAQFLGAFNDNAFKMLAVLLAWAALPNGDEAGKQRLATLGMVALTLPLALMSLPAMVLGDRISKRRLVLWTKLAELLLMGLATVALAVAPDGWLPFVVLVGMERRARCSRRRSTASCRSCCRTIGWRPRTDGSRRRASWRSSSARPARGRCCRRRANAPGSPASC